MKMKKKVLTSTLATSLVVSSLTGIPAYAASLPTDSEFTQAYATFQKAFAKLTQEDKDLLKAARDVIASDAFDDTSLANPIFTKVKAKAEAEPEIDFKYVNDKEKLFSLVKVFAESALTADESSIIKIYTDPSYRELISELFQLGGQDPLESGDLKDVAGLFNDIEEAVKAEILKTLKSANITDLKAKTVQDAVQTAAVKAFNANNSKTVKALKGINITADDLIQTKSLLEKKLVSYNTDKFDFGKIDVVLATAYLSTLDYPTTNAPGGFGPGGFVSTEAKGPDIKAAEADIAKVTATLADILKDKSVGEAKATEAVQEALFQAAVINLSGAVKTKDGKAVVTLDASKLGDIFKTLKGLADTANKALKGAAPNATPVKPVAVLDLGAVTAKQVEFPLAKEVLAAAKTNGIELLGLKVNGVVLAADLDQLGAAATVNINQLEKTAIPASSLTSASEVFEFSFTVDGSAKGTFDKPIEVRLPVAISGLDQELLAFTKIDGNNLIFKGGKYDTNKKTFLVANKSFSSYTVLENKVSFTDIAGVKDWAGRQISVAAAKGIIDGRAEGQFVPNASVTRAEFAKLVVTALGLESATAKESFTDVDAKSWYQPYVAAAAEAGLINGRAEGIFAPEATITRAELATIAARALEKVKSYKPVAQTDAALAVFKDAADVHATLKSGVAFATEQGLVVGQDEALFNPNASTTRAEAAVVIYRLFNK